LIHAARLHICVNNPSPCGYKANSREGNGVVETNPSVLIPDCKNALAKAEGALSSAV
jgi:hypothetical protein